MKQIAQMNMMHELCHKTFLCLSFRSRRSLFLPFFSRQPLKVLCSFPSAINFANLCEIRGSLQDESVEAEETLTLAQGFPFFLSHSGEEKILLWADKKFFQQLSDAK